MSTSFLLESFNEFDYPLSALCRGGLTSGTHAWSAGEDGIEDVTFHSMRHAFASRMISRGISSTVLAALMEHESSAITEPQYIHLFDS
jgi:integrase